MTRPTTRYALFMALFVAMFSFVAATARPDPVSQAVHLIATWEGFSPTPYQDQAGCWTIGYGHLLSCGGLEPVMDPVTEEDAEAWLRQTWGHIIDHIVFDLRA